MQPDAAVRSAAKQYPDGTIGLHDVSLEVQRGQFFSLLGPSGCGKSTLLKLLAGIEPPTRGEVFVRGQKIHGNRIQNDLTSLVFQRLALFPQMTVYQNIAFGPKMHRKPAQEVRHIVDEQLEMIGLSKQSAKYPSELSGGQQQRVAIARSLANKPAVLLLDEPLSSLDLKLRVQMQGVLKDIQRTAGTTFIYVTHDQSEAFTLSDEMAVMNEGYIVQTGRPVDLYKDPQTDFVADFVGDTNLFYANDDKRPNIADRPVSPTPDASCVSVRPEAVSLEESADLKYAFKGHVTDTVFRGPSIRVHIVAEDDRNILCDIAADTLAPDIGQELTFGWNPTSSREIP